MLLSLKKTIYKIVILPYLNQRNARLVKGKPKIFIIGRNKTGTTSLHHEFLERGYIVGNQRQAELMLKDYIQGNFKPILEYCKTAQVFQDVPFSYSDTFKHLNQAFPDAKFILTIRDSPDQWYNSVTKFQSKLFGSGRLPTKEDLQNAKYVYKGWMWESNRSRYNTPDDDLYNKEALIRTYIDHNADVREYFKDNPNFLEINVSEEDAYTRFCEFLNLPLNGKDSFPWSNKTSEITTK